MNPQKVWDDLHLLAVQGTDLSPGSIEPIVLCYEVIPKKHESTLAINLPDGSFCHRRMFAEWIERELGHEVKEGKYVPPSPSVHQLNLI
ncbi:hypothetical protein H6G00_01885 [Leptolyngbya sp. FACHB-541]|nr:hypothetical protein [Leptolyngbya sp. FACHB-541]